MKDYIRSIVAVLIFVKMSILSVFAAPYYPNFSYNATYTYDIINGSYLQYWLYNMSVHGDFAIYGFIYSLIAPEMALFDYWIFVMIWLTALGIIWMRTQEVTIPLIVGLLSAGVWSYLFPEEALIMIGAMLAICMTVILVRTFKDPF